MNFNKALFDSNNNKDLNIFRTFRSTSNLQENYALICSIPMINKKISATCNIECISNEKFEYGFFRFGIREDNTTYINESISPNEFKIVGDKVGQYFNIYVKTNIVGSTVVITVDSGSNLGFIDFKNLSTFSFLETDFTSKVLPTSNVKFVNASVQVNGGLNLTNNVVLNGGTSAKSYYAERTNNGIVNRLFSYVSNLGYAIFGRCKDNNNSLADFATALILTENDIRVACQSGGSLCPDKANQYDLGKNDLRFNRLFLNKGIILADTKPSTPINCESYFDITSKKIVTYYGGKWYSNGIEVVV